MNAIGIIIPLENLRHIDDRNPCAPGGGNTHNGRIIGSMRRAEPLAEWDELGHDDLGAWQAHKNIVQECGKIAGRRAAVSSANVVRANMEQDDVRLIGCQPALRIDPVLDLRNSPTRMSLIGQAASGVPFRAYESDGIAVRGQERGEQAPISAIARIGRSEGNGITQRHDFDSNCLLRIAGARARKWRMPRRSGKPQYQCS
jgi:hypothetical protein